MSLCLTSHNQFICNLISSMFKGFPKCVLLPISLPPPESKSSTSLPRPLQSSLLPIAKVSFQTGKSRYIRADHTQAISPPKSFPTTLRVTSPLGAWPP